MADASSSASAAGGVSLAADSTAAASASAAAAAPATATAASSVSFSFSSTARAPRRVVHVQPRPVAPSDAPSRQLVTGSLSASSLARSHAASEDPTYGKTQLVIPLIKQTNWRTKLQSSAADAAVAKGQADVAELRSRDSASKGGVQFESEAELLEQAQEEANRVKAAAQATEGDRSDAKMTDDSPPPLQGPPSSSSPSVPDADAAAILALEESAAAALDGPSSDLPSAEQQAAFARAKPILMSNALPGNSSDLSEADRLKLDVDQRPDMTEEDYRAVPIEEFGSALLRGMGWKGLGDPIGGINKAVVTPVQFAPRGERMGLGAEFAKPKDSRGPKKYIKPGETREPTGVVRNNNAAAASTATSAAELKAKTLRSLGSRLIQVHSQQLRVGALVEVMTGVHRKHYGTIRSFGDVTAYEHVDDVPLDVYLNLTETVVSCLRGEVEILDERAMPEDHPAFETKETRRRKEEKRQRDDEERREKEKALQKSDARTTRDRDDADRHSSKRHRSRTRSRSRDRTNKRDRSHRSRSRSRDRKRSRDRDHDRRDRDRDSTRDRDRDRPRPSSSSSSSTSAASTRPRWIRPHIRVRFLSRSLQGGRLYGTKGTVVDVASSSHCIIQPDDSRGTVEQPESSLETVLPKAGNARVMILAGEHKGTVGRLMQKQAEREIAVVQLEEDLDLVQVAFDDIAEYVQRG